ncbi:MAG: hypothetical protein FJ254_09445 [Phycisphaerae bacterium]|nr:hypothetical protein [Phycisphaerae bacterium]
MARWTPPGIRLDYVKRELLANGFGADPGSLLDRVALELSYALFAPVHEQHQPCYGAIVTDQWSHHANCIPDYLSHGSIDGGAYERLLADGTNGFLVCERVAEPKAIWMPHSALLGEAALFSLRDEILFGQAGRSPHSHPAGTDLVLVQRLADGSVTVLHWDGVTSVRNGQWSHRHYQYRYKVEETLESRVGHLSDDMKQTIRSLLRICLHVLSPAGCGATIVAALDGDQELAGCLNCANALPALSGLTVRNKRHHRTLAHLLDQIDGAAVVAEAGDLKCVGAWLKPKDRRDSVSLGGSRQLTAQSTSASVASPILTVSADGPVRVFHRGELIADFSKPPP